MFKREKWRRKKKKVHFLDRLIILSLEFKEGAHTSSLLGDSRENEKKSRGREDQVS